MNIYNTMNLHAEFKVPYEYRVYFTRNLFDTANPLLREILRPSCVGVKPKVLVTLDSNAATARLREAIPMALAEAGADVAMPLLELRGGECVKADGFPSVREILQSALAARLDRHSYVLAIGGGSLLDVAGFAAAIFHRGVRLVRVPTTVLGQNDAGVGVKNSVDMGGHKNIFGTFAPPWAVVNDFSLLETLAPEARLAGISEAVKVAAIKDASFLRWLGENAERLRVFEPEATERMIRECARLHVEHIVASGDPFESGSARPLDFGHWLAHRLESVSGYSVSHGFAVAIGICVDSEYAAAQGWLSAGDAAKIRETLAASGVLDGAATAEKWLERPENLLIGLDEFREHLGGELTVTFPGPLGELRNVHVIDRKLMKEIILSFATRYGCR